MNRVKGYLTQKQTPRWVAPEPAVSSGQRKPLSWVRFTWNLAALPEILTTVPQHYQITRATPDDDTALRKIFSASFMLDPVWSPAIGDVMRKVHAWLDQALESDQKLCLALCHGSRIIGAALLHLGPNVEDQLAPGPTISLEYRNRGFGTLLLEHSLRTLRDGGLQQACSLTRDLSPAAKFVYPKFGGSSAPVDSSVLAAA
jgi:GNAT superfamily N-acetyltransferase